MNKKGFVLLETIVVISVLCVVLIMLFASYSNILLKVKKKSLYDNTEYIYKTTLIRDYLEDTPPTDYESSNVIQVCSNIGGGNADYTCSSDPFYNDLGVEAIYISVWNLSSISSDERSMFEATTLNYLNSLDPTNINGAFRIIVMFKQENNDTDKDVYEYATLRFGNRG